MISMKLHRMHSNTMEKSKGDIVAKAEAKVMLSQSIAQRISFYLGLNRDKKIRKLIFGTLLLSPVSTLLVEGADHKIVQWWIGFLACAHRLTTPEVNRLKIECADSATKHHFMQLVLMPRYAYKLSITHQNCHPSCCVACAFACNLIGLLRCAQDEDRSVKNKMSCIHFVPFTATIMTTKRFGRDFIPFFFRSHYEKMLLNYMLSSEYNFIPSNWSTLSALERCIADHFSLCILSSFMEETDIKIRAPISD